MNVATNNNQAATTNSDRVLRSRSTAQQSQSVANERRPNTRSTRDYQNSRTGGRRAAAAVPAAQASGSGYAVARVSSGNVHTTVPQPIFTFVAPPKVTDVSHEALTRWLDLRLEYEEMVRAKTKHAPDDINVEMTSVRNSFDEALLDTLCEGVWAVDKSDLTEEFLWNWIKTTVESFKNKILPNIKDLFARELKMDESLGDVQAQVVNYLHLCNTIIRTNGLVGLFAGEAGGEKKCKILIHSLPERLKQRVNNEIEYNADGATAKKSIAVLISLITAQALEQRKVYYAVRNVTRKRGHSDSNDNEVDERSQRFKRRTTAKGNNGRDQEQSGQRAGGEAFCEEQ